MSAVPETKKEQILNLARRDPFLKIEEIAATVETTPRYVRTILSEAKVSLMQLRRNYARRMEKRLGIDVTVKGNGPGLASVLASTGKRMGVNEIRVNKIRHEEWARLLNAPVSEPLLVVSRVRVVNDHPFFISQVVTTGDLSLSEETLRANTPLRELLGLARPDVTEFRERSLEVEPADSYIAANLDIPVGDPVMRSGNLIVTEGRPVGLEFNIFPAYTVRFVLVGKGDYELKVVEKSL